MRRTEVSQVKTISAKSQTEFDKLYNSTARELGASLTEVKEIDATTARFYYSVIDEQVESLEDDFMQNNERCHCSDCPFLEIGTDARRKWFPCQYATYGESRTDSPACEVFYREAVKMMRERARS